MGSSVVQRCFCATWLTLLRPLSDVLHMRCETTERQMEERAAEGASVFFTCIIAMRNVSLMLDQHL